MYRIWPVDIVSLTAESVAKGLARICKSLYHLNWARSARLFAKLAVSHAHTLHATRERTAYSPVSAKINFGEAVWEVRGRICNSSYGQRRKIELSDETENYNIWPATIQSYHRNRLSRPTSFHSSLSERASHQQLFDLCTWVWTAYMCVCVCVCVRGCVGAMRHSFLRGSEVYPKQNCYRHQITDFLDFWWPMDNRNWTKISQR
jgi:hypothetical protein